MNEDERYKTKEGNKEERIKQEMKMNKDDNTR